MKPLTISLVALVAFAAGYAVAFRVAAQSVVQKPSYLAVSLAGDHFLRSVTTVVQDKKGRYVTQGDEIEFLNRGPKTLESTLQPFAFQFQRLDFFSLTQPRSALTTVFASERNREETFIVRDGKVVKVDPIARMNPER